MVKRTPAAPCAFVHKPRISLFLDKYRIQHFNHRHLQDVLQPSSMHRDPPRTLTHHQFEIAHQFRKRFFFIGGRCFYSLHCSAIRFYVVCVSVRCSAVSSHDEWIRNLEELIFTAPSVSRVGKIFIFTSLLIERKILCIHDEYHT